MVNNRTTTASGVGGSRIKWIALLVIFLCVVLFSFFCFFVFLFFGGGLLGEVVVVMELLFGIEAV